MKTNRWTVLILILTALLSRTVSGQQPETTSSARQNFGVTIQPVDSIDKAALNAVSEFGSYSFDSSKNLVPFPFSQTDDGQFDRFSRVSVISDASRQGAAIETDYNSELLGSSKTGLTGYRSVSGYIGNSSGYSDEAAGYGNSLAETSEFASPYSSQESQSEPLSRYIPAKPMVEDSRGRAGIFQKLTGKATYVSSGGGTSSLGLTTINLDLVLGVPFPARTSPLLLTPYFQADFMDFGNSFCTLPTSLYRTGVNVAWIKPINDQWGLFLFVSPCVSSDFHAKFDKAFRCPVGLIANWAIHPEWKLSLGIIYTDNDDWLFVPACGITWTPNELWKYELTVPRPRICRRIDDPFRQFRSVDAAGAALQDAYWLYLAGEYQAGAWAVDAPEYWGARYDDQLRYRDLRVMFGFERDRQRIGRIDFNAEIGVAFCRKLYFEDSPAVYHPKAAFVARLQALF